MEASDPLIDRHLPLTMADSQTASIRVRSDIYSRRAVLAAAYKLSARCAMLLDKDAEGHWVVYVVSIGEPASAVLPAFLNELVDQGLRDELEHAFGGLRALIVAQAFAEGDLLERALDEPLGPVASSVK